MLVEKIRIRMRFAGLVAAMLMGFDALAAGPSAGYAPLSIPFEAEPEGGCHIHRTTA